MQINFNLLRTFLLVADNGSFRDASEMVHRSQSAVSAQIKLLERQVGAELFHRTTRSVKLTRAGQQLFDSARRGLREVDAGIREIQETIAMQIGRVSLASTPVAAATLLPPVLAAFEKDYPAVRIFVKELPSTDLYASVLRGDVDFGIAPQVEAQDFDFEPVLQEDIIALVPRSLMPADTDRIGLKDLSKMPVLMQDNATSLRLLLDQAAERAGITLTSKYECFQAQTLIAMVDMQLGAAILPKSIVPSKPSKRMQALRIVSPTLTRTVGLVTVRGQRFSPTADRLAQVVRAVAPRALSRAARAHQSRE
ncbi:LysR family transcriptional regulator [Reyranella sp. CPCC 100927]|uniref:LysR family transcriptional regulator n=1 Tax=Reyranella sp. CPCC 100927 TaxID=2599616 RepID=UPI0011B5A65E|nr:LysR family transcriptional regulator [Reyranella sp. CPCC 100927]TWT11652.1 LysR family transcriptional regulator [Reyranella sp. CPCC 100927]